MCNSYTLKIFRSYRDIFLNLQKYTNLWYIKIKLKELLVDDTWSVYLNNFSVKSRKRLTAGVRCQLDLLLKELEVLSPNRSNWKNYSQLKKGPQIPANSHHCHIKKGKPTYVVCWRLVSKTTKEIEVFYVGTHENAPY